MEQALPARNLPPVGGGAIGYFVVMCFLLGILIVWSYAAVRPRLGPGPRTAVIVAALAWFMTLVWSGGAQVAMGIMPLNLTLLGLVWGLGEMVIASLVGARIIGSNHVTPKLQLPISNGSCCRELRRLYIRPCRELNGTLFEALIGNPLPTTRDQSVRARASATLDCGLLGS